MKNLIPDPIPASAEDIARVLLRTPPKKRDEWEYLSKYRAGKSGSSRKMTS